MFETGVEVGGKEWGEAEGDDRELISIHSTSIPVSTLIIIGVLPQK